MRLFTGIDLPESMTAEMDRLIANLKPAAKLRWSRAGNLHITTKFIGEWPEERLGELQSALAEVTAAEPVRVSLRGLGWFPNPHAPRILWVAVHGGEALRELARRTDAALSTVGIPKEGKEYTPHLTLARIPAGARVVELRQAVAGLPTNDWGSFETSVFRLYLSERTDAGSQYTRLAEFPFFG